MINLAQIRTAISPVVVTGPQQENLQLTGVCHDSRFVKPGELFVALPSVTSSEKGGKYLSAAIANGAGAIVCDTTVAQQLSDLPIPCLGVENPRRDLAKLAPLFFPGSPETIAAITGTNGKSSVAHFTYQLWQALGYKSAAMGTLGITGADIESCLTTPDTIDAHKALAQLSQLGVTHLALEAGSHGLDQYRLDGVHLTAGAFTNLSRDHLDYHGSLEAYYQAKKRLFAEVLPAGSLAVLNAAIEEV